MACSSPTDQQLPAVQISKGTGVFVPRDNSAARHRMLQARARSSLATDCARSSRSDAGHSPARRSGCSNSNRGTAREQVHNSMQQEHLPPAMMGSIDPISSFTPSKRDSNNGSSAFEHSAFIDFQFSEAPSAVSTPVLNSQCCLRSAAQFAPSPYSAHSGAELPGQPPHDFWSVSGASSPLASSFNPAASISSFSSDFSSSTGSLVNVDVLCEQLALLQQQDKLLQEKEHHLVMQQKLLQRLDSSATSRTHNSSSSSTTTMVNNNSINHNSISMPWSHSATMQQQEWQGPASYPLHSNSTMLSVMPAALAAQPGPGGRTASGPFTPGNSSAARHLSRTLSASAVPAGSSMGHWSASNLNNATAWQAPCAELQSAHHAAAAGTVWQSAAPVTAAPPMLMPAARPVLEVYSGSDQGARRTTATMAAKVAQLAELQALQQAIQQELLQLLC